MQGFFDAAPLARAGLELQFALRPGVSVECTGDTIGVVHPWGACRLSRAGPATAALLVALAAGLSSIEFEAAVFDGRGAAERLWAIEQLGYLIGVRVSRNGHPFFAVEPTSYAARAPLEWPSIGSGRLSPHAFLRRRGDELALESTVSAHRVVLHDPDAAAAVATSSFPAARRLPWVGLLAAAGMVEGYEDPAAAGLDSRLVAMGEFHDLLFHQRTTFGRHDEAFGATFPFSNDVPAPEPLAAAGGRPVPLPRPDAADVIARDPTLTEALERRLSERRHGEPAITVEQLAEFLFRCARTRATYGPIPEGGMPYEAVDRPYPAGGGIHDLEIYLLVLRARGLEPGPYHYVAHRHELEAMPDVADAAALVVASALTASGTDQPPQVLIKIASRFDRMAWKYRSIAYAASLKSVGVLYQTMYLVATAMGLAACALGSGDDVAGERLFRFADRAEVGVGEFLLGNGHAGPGPHAHRVLHPTWRAAVAPEWMSDSPSAARPADGGGPVQWGPSPRELTPSCASMSPELRLTHKQLEQTLCEDRAAVDLNTSRVKSGNKKSP